MDVVLILNTMQIQPTEFNIIKQELIKDRWTGWAGSGGHIIYAIIITATHKSQ